MRHKDLNEAQYAVICALCGADFKNLLMAGDPKQSIYGPNTVAHSTWRVSCNPKRFRLNYGFAAFQFTLGPAW